MFKRILILTAALLMAAAPARAEIYEGKTAAQFTVPITAAVSGIVESLSVQTGQRVKAAETVATLRSEKFFATQEGTVTMICANPDDSVSGTLIEVMPMECYTVYCTVDKAYQSVETTLIHSGETVYMKCTRDGTHRASGVITEVDGSEYQALILAGELYVGETVYIYRDADFTNSQRLGIGTVLTSDTEAYEATGKLTRLCVSEGDYVERGQLLFELDGGTQTAENGGIVTLVSVQAGNMVSEGQIIGEIAPADAICVEIQVDETSATAIRVGDKAMLTLACQTDEEPFAGTVTEISAIAESDLYTVRIRPETDQLLPLGMTVQIRI